MAKRKRLSFDGPALTRLSPEPPEGVAPIAGVVADASATAALAEVSETLEAAREGGRMILDLPLEQIRLDHLVRDRIVVDDAEMEALLTSLRDRGQQVPIDVTRLGPDSYGLISGWRRCHALHRLYQDTGEARFSTVQALIRQPGDASDAYRAMVEENEIRVGLSYYERARIVARAVEQGVFPSKKKALRGLFASASRAKRSKIGTFLPIVSALDGHLRHPEALTERVGLTLGRALDEEPDLAKQAVQALQAAAPEDGAAEVACLTALLQPPGPSRDKNADPAPSASEVLCPGIEMIVHKNGSLTLKGARVDRRLQDRLRAFLAHDKGADR